MSAKKDLELLINSYLLFLKNSKCCSREMIQIFEIPLRQMRDNCYWIEKENKIILDITPFRHLIAKNGKRAFIKKIRAIQYFVKYLNENLNLNVILKGGIENIDLKEVDDLESNLQELSKKEQLLIMLFYGMDLKLGEIISLKREMLDLENNLIKIGQNSYPISPKIKTVLKEYLKEFPKGKYLFEDGDKAFTINKLRSKLQKASKVTKLPQKQIRSSLYRYITSPWQASRAI